MQQVLDNNQVLHHAVVHVLLLQQDVAIVRQHVNIHQADQVKQDQHKQEVILHLHVLVIVLLDREVLQWVVDVLQ